jgi:molybdopterin synthase catalytic subunit
MDSNGQVKVKVLFFAKSRELSGLAETIIELPSKISYLQLHFFLCDKFNLEIIKANIILAVNQVYCEEDTVLDLSENSEIAVIPPLSGG